MKNTMVWIITIVLMSVDVYIIFTDPLERQYDLVQIVMAWYLVTLLLDFLFRHNNTYGVIRNVIATVLLCVLYFVFPSMYNNMRYAVVLIINIILVLAGFFLLIVDPLNKQLPVKMIAIWFIVFVILDYPLRHYKIYKEIRIFLYMIFLSLLYWLFPA